MTTNREWVMTGGEGPESYNQNSSFQRALLEVGKEKIKSAISATLSLDLISDRFTVADFGCASGPNTFVAVQNIVDAVEEKYRRGTGQNPDENIDFQVLFIDFTNNDFNTLFQALPLSRKYYSAGVPGSFFGRVLPKQSIHIGLINYAFHFISRTPRGTKDRDSPLWNRDMHCTGFNQAVKKAYLDQYSNDTNNLLDVRAEELVPGGLMLISGSCQREGVKISETAIGIGLDIIQASINDLAQQCVIEQEKVDSFNFPLYYAEESELRQIIEENGKFTLEVFEDIIYSKVDYQLDLKVFTTSIKAGCGPLLSTHFGAEAMEKVFNLVPVKAQEELPHFLNAKPGMQYLIVLRKN